MSQLVGSMCFRCGKKIGSIIEGKFCEFCGSSYHTACPRTAGPLSDVDYCSACGKKAPPLPRQSSNNSLDHVGDAARAGLKAYRVFKWFAAGVFATGLGVWMVLFPNLDGRLDLSASADRTGGFFALAAGLFILVVGYFTWIKK